MARKKIIDEAATETQVPQETVAEPQVSSDTTVEAQPLQEVVSGKVLKPTSTPELSDAVDKLLKSYPGYSTLYIDSKGGVYPKDTQPNLVKDAILYQNPYYKS